MAASLPSEEPTPSGAFDVEAFVQRQPFGRPQWFIILLIALVMAIDGYDLFLMGNVIPAIAADWRIAASDFAPLLTVQQAVLGLGGFALAPLADRFGRKAMILLCLIGIAITSAAASIAPSLTILAFARAGSALFMAGILPNAVALVSEYSPARSRATAVMIIFMGFSLGGIAGSFFGTLLASEYGWRAPILLGALLPLAMAALAGFLLPESIGFLTIRNAKDGAIPRLLRRLAPDISLTGEERFAVPREADRRAPVASLFHPGSVRTTALLWVIYALTMIHVGLVTAWMPTLLVKYQGISLPEAGRFIATMGMASIIGMTFFGRLMDRFGAARVIALGQLVGGACWVLLPDMSWASYGHWALALLIGLSSMSAQSGLSALASSLYPTACRATGLGWAIGFGRTVALTAPFIGAMALTGSFGYFGSIGIVALPLFLAGGFIALLALRLSRAENQ